MRILLCKRHHNVTALGKAHFKFLQPNKRAKLVSRIVIIIASIGRPELLSQTVAQLGHQTRPANHVLIVSVTPEDVAGLNQINDPKVEIIFAAKGLPRQRNAGLRHIGDKADIIVFFDDDFVPAETYLAELEGIFAERPDVVGATGRLIADGIKSPGITFDDGLRMIANDQKLGICEVRFMPALYGCNLCFRAAAAKGIWFDEELPLYGWQEDVDFSYQLGQRGPMLRTGRLAGVHLGAKGGRQSGKRLGYSQIANPIYLLRKKTIPRKLAWRLMTRNIAANLTRSAYPEPYIDRAGRLWGNLLAIGHLMTGTLHPQRILKF
jgi:GT2 family glycosyltransferase